MVSGHISEETIREVFDLSILDVLRDYLDLKKAGANYKCKSPFTDEKTPSFVVNPAKGIFKDFSGGKGGNLINFVMEYEGLSYPEAIETIAKKHNIPIKRKKATTQDLERFRLVDLLVDTTTHYQDMLSKHPQVLDYFHNRGFTDESITAFKLGYAPPGREHNVREILLEKGYTLEEMVRAGVAKQKEGYSGNYHDFFWNRAMFPIMNRIGNTIGFGGRFLTPEGDSNEKAAKAPKYMNSPETPVFNKSDILYGVGIPAINRLIGKAETVAIVEGYTDVITMQQAGIPTLGKLSGQFTEKQLNTLARYNLRTIDIVDDGDLASTRGIMLDTTKIAGAEYWPNIIMLPEGQDPADFFNAQENPLHTYNTMERLSPVVFYARAAKRLLVDKKSEEEAKILLDSTMNKLFIAQNLMEEYLSWYGSDGIISGHLIELEKELELPKETLVALHFEKYKEKYKLRANRVPEKRLRERVMLDYFAGLLITPTEYATKFFTEIPVDHHMFTPEQQELYKLIKEVKEEHQYKFKVRYSKDVNNNKVATLREEIVRLRKSERRSINTRRGRARPLHPSIHEEIKFYGDDERLFPAADISPTVLFVNAYDDGKLSTMPVDFINRIKDYFPADIEFSAGSVKEYMKHEEEKQLFNDLFVAQRTGDTARVEVLTDRLDILRR